MTNEIPKELIERALALCGKEYWDMSVWVRWEYEVEWVFSHPCFFYYLLSPEFLYKYNRHTNYNIDDAIWWKEVWEVCTEYQKGNSEPIISLLSKIWN
jgi:hypothetical protein